MIHLKNGKFYNAIINCPENLSVSVVKVLNTVADHKLQRLRNSNVYKIGDKNDLEVLRLTGTETHIFSLWKLKRDFDEWITFDAPSDSVYSFHIGCDHERFFLEKTQSAPNLIETPYSDFLSCDHGGSESCTDIYLAYLNTDPDEPMTRQALFKKVRLYYPEATMGRASDKKRTRIIKGVKLL